ncbi:MAG: methylglyoxal synthase [Oscillospiraceae bacterium]|nr:methylglyoxal synthase [Oscillospiraceae bacterium]
MNIALLAHDNKKELLGQFCFAYRAILAEHRLNATSGTGHLIIDSTALPVRLCLSGVLGGREQIAARIAYNDIDLVIFFCDPYHVRYSDDLAQISKMCDQYSIPLATNVATAEVLILGLQRGDLAWRDIVRGRK